MPPRSPALLRPLPAVLLMGLLLACAGKSKTLREQAGEHEYAQPLEDVWPAARGLLKDQGFSVRDDGKFTMATEWRERYQRSGRTSGWERYLVRGWNVAPLRSTIRIYRQMRTHGGMLSESPDTALPDNVVDNNATIGLIAQPEYVFGEDPAEDSERAQASRDAERNNLLSGSVEREGGPVATIVRDLDMEWALLKRTEPELAARMQGISRPAELAAAPEELVPLAASEAASTPAPTVSDALCGPQPEGSSALARPGRVLLLGETPGTHEIPAAAGALVCHLGRQGVALTFALELPRAEQARVERFLDCAGSAEDRRLLLNGPFWHRTYQDGRSSTAMLKLLESVRAQRAAGLPIEVLAFDTPAPPEKHDALMAQSLLAERTARPERMLVVLTGNVHARTVPGVQWDPTFRPLGHFLAQREKDLVSLDVDHAGGASWSCKLAPDKRLQCGAARESPTLELRKRFLSDERVKRTFLGDDVFVVLGAAPSPEGYAGLYYVGMLSPAEPAEKSAPTAVR
jgi:hypothetical protein